ncbi:MAG: DUF1688 family protein, partial [Polyangiales bacterium]
MAESVAYLRTPKAIREQCNAVLALGLEGKLAYFSVDLASVERVADYVTAVTRAEYPDLKV